jgi:putative flippase GtrA
MTANDPGSAKHRCAASQQAISRGLKFYAVGGVGIGVQFAVLAFCRSLLHMDYRLATLLAVETAVIHNFAWHEKVTWADRGCLRRPNRIARFLKFNLTNGLLSIAGNLLLMQVLVGGLALNYLVANLVSVAICSLANFAVSDRFVFQA